MKLAHAVIVLFLVAGCSTGTAPSTEAAPSREAAPSTGPSVAPEASASAAADVSADCMDAVTEAANIDSMSDTVEDFDQSIATCDSLDEWTAAIAAQVDALDGVDPLTFLGNRCSYAADALGATTACEEIVEVCDDPAAAISAICIEQGS